MTTLTETFATIIKVTYTNYSENIKVNSRNAQELRDLINNDSEVESWEVATQGDYKFELNNNIKEVECQQFYRDGSIKNEEIFTLEFKGDKVKPLEDTCESYEPRFQKIKEGSNGRYFIFLGERWFLD